MKLSNFDYNLPPELIAKFPPEIRGTTRLLVLNRVTGEITHKHYSDLIDYLNPGDVLILNDTKVIKARLITSNRKGEPTEIFLLENHGQPDNPHTHTVIYRGKLKNQEILTIGRHEIIVEQLNNDGTATITSSADLNLLADNLGQVPLPPYMKRRASVDDTERYQTVFAKHPGSVAAPTASLNMTEELLEKIKNKGISIHYLTLHVGLGTFMPIKTDDLTHHHMHSEYFQIPADTIKAIRQAKTSGREVVAIGTTVTRALEFAHIDVLDSPLIDENRGVSGEANIFIYPGYEFKVIDKLVTNFHAPKSTVLMLTAAFAGWEHLKTAYDEAIQEEYSFLSYGDSMLIR